MTLDLIFPCENCGIHEAVDERLCTDCLIVGNPVEKIPLGVGGDDLIEALDSDFDVPVKTDKTVARRV